MSDSHPTLEQLQRWFSAVVTTPAGVQAGIASDGAQQQLRLHAQNVEQVILPSRQLSAEQRLAIYHNAYFARLIEALRAFLPCLSDTLGEELFAKFAVAYLHRYPSQSYTLHRLADRFACFLEETRPTEGVGEAADWSRFWVDLARLELVIDRVFDGPGPERSPEPGVDRIVAVAAKGWPDVRLQLVEGLTLLEFNFPVSEFYTSWKRGAEPVLPLESKEYVALFRRGFVVRRETLAPVQFVLLQSFEKGLSVGESIEQVAELVDDYDALAANLTTWFQRWVMDRVIVGVRESEEN
jgi:hypothetical protein